MVLESCKSFLDVGRDAAGGTEQVPEVQQQSVSCGKEAGVHNIAWRQSEAFGEDEWSDAGGFEVGGGLQELTEDFHDRGIGTGFEELFEALAEFAAGGGGQFHRYAKRILSRASSLLQKLIELLVQFAKTSRCSASEFDATEEFTGEIGGNGSEDLCESCASGGSWLKFHNVHEPQEWATAEFAQNAEPSAFNPLVWVFLPHEFLAGDFGFGEAFEAADGMSAMGVGDGCQSECMIDAIGVCNVWPELCGCGGEFAGEAEFKDVASAGFRGSGMSKNGGGLAIDEPFEVGCEFVGV